MTAKERRRNLRQAADRIGRRIDKLRAARATTKPKNQGTAGAPQAKTQTRRTVPIDLKPERASNK